MNIKKALTNALVASTVAVSLFGLATGAQAAFNSASSPNASTVASAAQSFNNAGGIKAQLVPGRAPAPTFWKLKCWYDQQGVRHCRNFWIP